MIIIMDTRTCSICNKILPKSEFTDRTFCRNCFNERRRLARAAKKNQTDQKPESELPVEITTASNLNTIPELEQEFEIPSNYHYSRLELFLKNHKKDEDFSITKEYVYIITSPLFEILKTSDVGLSVVKIGKHTGTKKELFHRYHTPLENVNIIRFVEVKNARKHEKTLHEIFKDFRRERSEWFVIEMEYLLKIFDDYFDMLEDAPMNIFKRHFLAAFDDIFIKSKVTYESIEQDLIAIVSTFQNMKSSELGS